MTRKDFLNAVEDFLERHTVSPTMFGKMSIGEPNLVFDLRKGRECREKTQERVLDFIAANDNAEPDDKGAA